MNVESIAAASLALLLVAAGGGAALTGTVQSTAADAEEATGPRNVDVSAAYDNGTVTLTVTADGAGVENVTVVADDERVGTTGPNGTVTFETNASDELELELTKGEFEGTLTYQLQDGSLTLVEEEYEYAELEDGDGEDGEESEVTEDADDDGAEDEADDESESDDE